MTPALRQILLGGGPRPELSLDFVNGVYANRSGRFSNPADVGLVCTRSTAAYDLTTSGAAIPFAANTPRIVPGRGLGVWEARTQRFILPFAPATQSISLPSTGSYCLSVGPGGSVAIAAGTATISGAGTASFGSNVVINCTGTGTVTCTVTSSPAWVQLEAGAFATPPINAPTTATACSQDVNLITGLSIRDGFTVVADVELPFAATATFPWLWGLSDGTTSNVAGSFCTASTAQVQSYLMVGGIDQGGPNVGAVGYTRGAVSRIAIRFSAGSRRGARDGVLGTNDTDDLAAPTLSTLAVGCRPSSTSQLNGYIKKLAIYQTPFSDAQLQAATT